MQDLSISITSIASIAYRENKGITANKTEQIEPGGEQEGGSNLKKVLHLPYTVYATQMFMGVMTLFH